MRFTFKENEAKIVQANLIYTFNGETREEEWFRQLVRVLSNTEVVASLLKRTTH